MTGPTPAPPRQGGESGIQPWVFKYRGITMGDPRGDVFLDSVDGLSRPDARVEATERQQDHGALILARYLKERILTFQGTIFGDDGVARQANRERMDAAFAPIADDDVLAVALDDGTYRRAYCKPTRFAYSGNRAFALARVPFALELQAGDPRWYDDSQDVVTLAPQGPEGGFIFPLVFPLVFPGDGGSGIGIATNDGTIDTPPVMKIYGPATDPQILNLTTGTSLIFQGTIPAGSWLEVDFKRQTILLDGDEGASRYYMLESGSWDGLVPGDNALQFIASSPNAGTKVDVIFRSAWAGI